MGSESKKESMLTYSFRIKDQRSKIVLRRMARSVNFLWNFCNETTAKAYKESRKWLTKYDFNPLVKGSSKDLGLHSQTVQLVAYEHATRRNQFKKSKLRWRSKKSLGWIPLGKDGIRIEDGILIHNKNEFKFWQSREIEGKIKCGSICEDSRGRWYLNLQCEVEDQRLAGNGEVGLDLGLKTFATESNGKKTDTGRWFRRYERKLGIAQQKRKKRLAKTIHAKIRNKRKDDLHKLSHELVQDNGLIAVGDVGGEKLTKTKMAKSVLDAGWSSFRSMLKYKAIRRRGVLVVVNERDTTRTCSYCGAIPDSAPKGVKGLGTREWVCNVCDTVHDRDVNAARNILRLGHQTLRAGVPQESPTITALAV